jgi:hypothetical protein
MTDASRLQRTAQVSTELLRKAVEADWTVGVPELELTVARAVAHMAEVCLWYAIDLAAAGTDLQLVEHRVPIRGSNCAGPTAASPTTRTIG